MDIGPGGLFMTVMYEPARLNRLDVRCMLPLTHEEGATVGVGSVQAVHGHPVRGIS
jgi:2-keto-4-pentenoate hydratase